MGISIRSLEDVTNQMRPLVDLHLDPSLSFTRQNEQAMRRYIAECSKIPILKRYRNGADCWPAAAYARLRLRSVSNIRSKLQRAQTPRPASTTRGVRDRRPQQTGSGPSRRTARSEEPRSDEEDTMVDDVGNDIRTIQRASTHNPFVKSESEIVEIPAPFQENAELTEFLSAMEPPQPHLQRVLVDAGIKDMEQLRFLARHQSSIETFLRELVSAKALTVFEYTYLTAALKVLR
ncbi:hypothetical protein BDW22DRAFT_1486332 [Trametopsis cervina]|nr:hypothetical protein BDW22DRAFT_1486332 [Trametopsis cervina]